MRTLQVVTILVSLLLVTSLVEGGRRKKNKGNSDGLSTKTKTKTKWSSSTDLGVQSQNSMVATEEHGYYVKRTFLPLSENSNSSALKSPPFLAVPIAWFPCPDKDCMKLNSLAINSNKNSLAEGFLCDDDCTGPYEPVCGKTSSEVAVFYNKCKLNVAKCRSHSYWTDLSCEECKKQYPEEVKYADKKFRANPYFREEKLAVSEKQTSVILQDEKQEAEITTSLPVTEVKAEQQVLIKEIHQKEAQEKQPESKDHYEEIKTPTEAAVTKM